MTAPDAGLAGDGVPGGEGWFGPGLADAVLLDRVAAFYRSCLPASDEAAAFLERHRIDPAAVDAFGVGFSDRSLGKAIPDNRRVAGRLIRSQLTRLGVFALSGHEAFRGSIVVPVTDVDGAVVQLYGRKAGPALRAGTVLHTWAGGDRPVFNPSALNAHREVIVCASIIDALTLWSAGFVHVVAVDDLDHLDAVTAAGIERVLFAFRRDVAGHTATVTAADRLLAAGVECFSVELPHGMDVNDYARSSANPTDALAKAIRSAVWLGNGTPPSQPPNPPTPPASPASEVDDLVEDQADDDDAARPVVEVDANLDEVHDEPVDDVVVVSPVPLPLTDPTSATFDGEALRLTFGERRWRIRNLERNTSFDVLRVNVCVTVAAGGRDVFHVDVLDLYSARARAGFVRDAADELGIDPKVIKGDLARVFGAVEAHVEAAIRRAQEPVDTTVHLDADERAAALALLRDPNLIDRIVADFAKAGMVGEASNCLVGYLAAVSRKLARPLAVIVQSTSAAGKSALMEAVLEFVPGEERIKYSAMTGQSLYYLGEHDLAHKVLAIAEEEGAERASYALKLLQSEGELSIASTGKDTATGRLTTHEYRVTGPASIFLTTTAIDIDEELLNRCVVLTVDEDQAQTRAIHDRQRAAHTLDGLLAGNDRARVIKVHQDAQRLLEPVTVVNPYADRLGFADGATRTRRDHVKYLTLIDAVALLHQHQRPKCTATTAAGETVTYIEATLDDIALANRLAHEALGRSLDELPPQTRRLLDALDSMVSALAADGDIDRDTVRFTRRDARERLGLGDTQLKVHLARLVDLELVWVHRTERAGAFCYQLAWNPDTAGESGRFLPGLVDTASLAGTVTMTARSTDGPAATNTDRSGQTGTRSGQEAGRSGSGRPPVGGWSAPGRTPTNGNNGQVNGHKPGVDHANGSERAVRVAGVRPGRTRTGTTPAAAVAGRNGSAR